MKNMILEPLSFYPKRSGAYKYNGFSVFLKKKRVFANLALMDFQGGQGGSRDVRLALRNFQGGPRQRESGPREPFLEGPGSAKVRQGSVFDGNTGLILRFSFLALNDSWKVPRGSPERGAEQQEFRRGAQGHASISLWGPEGGPKTNGDPRSTMSGD